MDDVLVHKFRQKYPFVDDYTIKINMNKLYQHVTEFKNCSNCPGLENCPNDMTGHYTMLTAESVNEKSFIHEEKVACKKFIAEAAAGCHKQPNPHLSCGSADDFAQLLFWRYP